MKKFEYRKEVCRYTEDRIVKLNELGEQGWELVSLIEYGESNENCYVYLKREINKKNNV